jgi:hypothetical protein
MKKSNISDLEVTQSSSGRLFPHGLKLSTSLVAVDQMNLPTAGR